MFSQPVPSISKPRAMSNTDEICPSTVRVPAVTHPSELRFGPDDVVVLTMKTQDTEAALRDLRAAGADPWEMPIFCAQNTVANEPIAVRYFRRVYGVLIVIPGIYLEAGVIHNPIRGNAGMMDLGLYPHGIDETAEQVAACLRTRSSCI